VYRRYYNWFICDIWLPGGYFRTSLVWVIGDSSQGKLVPDDPTCVLVEVKRISAAA
jgi:hypothetical protein